MVDAEQTDGDGEHQSALDRLRGKDVGRWPNLAAAAKRSRTRMDELAALASDVLPANEGSFVVFGSMARRELTTLSDLDWTILIDGRVATAHMESVHKLTHELDAAGFPPPGPTGIFGGLTFSHDLVHAIGGDEDTNKNTTRRLLLILESSPVDVVESTLVHERVIKAVIDRYVNEDASFFSGEKINNRVPRFLLNDVVRFWRTMAVDYASKNRARNEGGWALRNIKLRMSRKLLFVAGLFMCMSWALENANATAVNEEFVKERIAGHLQHWISRSPLEALASVIETYAPDLSTEIFDPYDEFLALLSNDEERLVLKNLPSATAFQNEIYQKARQTATRFDKGLRKLLFESDSRITSLTQKYGVF